MGNESLPHESSENSRTPPNEKDEAIGDGPEQLENIRTISRVPGNDHYYEKGGLRTYGDDEDHDHEPPVGAIDGFPRDISTDSIFR